MYPTQERRKEDDERASTTKPSASTASSSSSNSVYLRILKSMMGKFYCYVVWVTVNENVDAQDDDVPIAMNVNAAAVAAGRAFREAIADQAVGNGY
ncbi:hypothetical protein Taro_005934 [Colocasia esculenta]|uniref:Uncharacterized protein n=1 Tax=Colocasia esculenta TaxID=4460 RepID=A0A843TZ94_COLES|nr:hypothetical protein [Colocasia esculenta]